MNPTISDINRRLVVISNRAPYNFEIDKGQVTPKKTIGGLVTALEPTIIDKQGAWIAWGTLPQLKQPIDLPPRNAAYKFYPVQLTEEEIQGFYHGFSNSVLWPLCHYFTDNLDIQLPQRSIYARVNGKYADMAVKVTKGRDFIWIQDYQLGLVPGMIRNQLPKARIGFFWHIPFPSVDVFSIIPGARGFLEGMLGADRIGFHVPHYVHNFLHAVEDLTKYHVNYEKRIVVAGKRQVQVDAWPISVDFDAIEKQAKKGANVRRAKILKEKISAGQVVLGVDRLDYTKGILERLYAIDRFFAKRPRYRGKVSFIQVAAPSRSEVETYQDLKFDIDRTVGEINGKYASLGWNPIHYFYKGFSFKEVVQLYTIADVALVTPLVDGMNLVAKEYVSAKIDNDGVLILSERTGSAHELREAIQVNPYDIEETEQALAYALKLSKQKRMKTMAQMRQRIKDWDIFKWNEAFLSGSPATFDEG